VGVASRGSKVRGCVKDNNRSRQDDPPPTLFHFLVFIHGGCWICFVTPLRPCSFAPQLPRRCMGSLAIFLSISRTPVSIVPHRLRLAIPFSDHHSGVDCW